GYLVDVICCAFHDLPKFEVINGVNVYRIEPWFFKTIYRKNLFENKKEAIQAIHDAQDAIIESKIVGKAYQISNMTKWIAYIREIFLEFASRLFHYFWWPDFGMFWILPAYKICNKLISKNSYKRIFAISWPVSAHVVGYLLACKKNRISTSIIMDIGDPFSTNQLNPPNNFDLYKSVNKFFEKKVLDKVDGISVTTPQTKKLYIETFKIEENKIEVIPPLLNHQEKTKNTFFTNYQSQKKTIRAVYIGSFRKVNRPPDFLIHLFKDLCNSSIDKKFELHIIGDYSDCKNVIDEARNNLYGCFFTYGVMRHEKALQALNEADVLINIGNKSEFQVPSKLVEYIASGNPIINIQFIENDSSFRFLKNYPSLCNLNIFDEKYESIFTKTIDFISNLPTKIPQEYVANFLKKNSVKGISNMYLSTWWK
ncbi:MAG: glycosyltransferase family 4 protein, partial [Crenarchaeota archaeon]|nr:glycosyltransferase family 4 protein [Thermoproteota archaeon]